MRFRKGARLDPSQVEDYRGQRTGGLPGGMPVTLGGGGGVIGIIVLLAFLFLSGGGGLGDLGSLAGQTVGPTGQPSGEIAQNCQTGADANEREDCRIVAVINSVQEYWTRNVRNYQPAKTRFFEDGISAGALPRSLRRGAPSLGCRIAAACSSSPSSPTAAALP